MQNNNNQLGWRDLQKHNANAAAIATGEKLAPGEKAKIKRGFNAEAIYIKGIRLPDDFLHYQFSESVYGILDAPSYVNNPKNTEKVLGMFKKNAIKFINSPKQHFLDKDKPALEKLINSITSLDDITYSVSADKYANGGELTRDDYGKAVQDVLNVLNISSAAFARAEYHSQVKFSPNLIDGFKSVHDKIEAVLLDANKEGLKEEITDDLAKLEFITNELRMERGLIRENDVKSLRNYIDIADYLLDTYWGNTKAITEDTYVYKFSSERGEISAYVEDMNTGATVWQFNYPDTTIKDEEEAAMQTTPVDDGFMKHWDDVDGLCEYLIDLKILPEGAALLTEAQAQKKHDYYKHGGAVAKTEWTKVSSSPTAIYENVKGWSIVQYDTNKFRLLNPSGFDEIGEYVTLSRAKAIYDSDFANEQKLKNGGTAGNITDYGHGRKSETILDNEDYLIKYQDPDFYTITNNRTKKLMCTADRFRDVEKIAKMSIPEAEKWIEQKSRGKMNADFKNMIGEGAISYNYGGAVSEEVTPNMQDEIRSLSWVKELGKIPVAERKSHKLSRPLKFKLVEYGSSGLPEDDETTWYSESGLLDFYKSHIASRANYGKMKQGGVTGSELKIKTFMFADGSKFIVNFKQSEDGHKLVPEFQSVTQQERTTSILMGEKSLAQKALDLGEEKGLPFSTTLTRLLKGEVFKKIFADGGILEKDKCKALALTTNERIILNQMYQSRIDGLDGQIGYFKSGNTRYHDEQVRTPKSSEISRLEEKKKEIKNDISFLYDEKYPYDITNASDARSFLRDLNDLPKNKRGRELFIDNEVHGDKFYEDYLKLYYRLEKFVEDNYGEEYIYKQGGSVNTSSGYNRYNLNLVAPMSFNYAAKLNEVKAYWKEKHPEIQKFLRDNGALGEMSITSASSNEPGGQFINLLVSFKLDSENKVGEQKIRDYLKKIGEKYNLYLDSVNEKYYSYEQGGAVGNGVDIKKQFGVTDEKIDAIVKALYDTFGIVKSDGVPLSSIYEVIRKDWKLGVMANGKWAPTSSHENISAVVEKLRERGWTVWDKWKTGGSLPGNIVRLTESNKQSVTNSFLRLSKANHYEGEYEFEDEEGLTLEWGKYGYNVSEDEQSTDFNLLAEAVVKFNAEFFGTYFASVSSGDKFNTVHIYDMAQLAENSSAYGKVARNHKKLYAHLKKLGLYNQRVDLEVANEEEKENRLRKSKSAAEAIIGGSVSDNEIYALSRTREYMGNTPVVYELSLEGKKVQDFKTPAELFAFLKSETFFSDFFYSGRGIAEAHIRIAKDDKYRQYVVSEEIKWYKQLGTFTAFDLDGGKVANDKAEFKVAYFKLIDKAEKLFTAIVINKMEHGGSLPGNYEVELAAEPNPDHDKNSWEGSVKKQKKRVAVKSIEDAQSKVNTFIEENNLGGGNFIPADVFNNGTKIGYISYNGKYWPAAEPVKERIKLPSEIDFFWVTQKKEYKAGDHIVYQDTEGTFNKFGKVVKAYVQDRTKVYDVIGKDKDSYLVTHTANELRPEIWKHKDFFVIPDNDDNYVVQSRDGVNAYSAKDIEAAKEWIDSQYGSGGSVEFGDFGEDFVAWRLANYIYDRAYTGATIPELLRVAKAEKPNTDWLPIDILIKVKNVLVPKGYVLTDENMFVGKVYWHPYAPKEIVKSVPLAIK